MKSNFEIAPKEYHIFVRSYDECILYCFQLNINGKTGWRLPTYDEYKQTETDLFDDYDSSPWFFEDDESESNVPFPCIPVRDIT